MNVDTSAQRIWEYMQLHQSLHKADAIFVLCSLDTRVATYAAQLYQEGYANRIILSGGIGKLTEHLFTTSEARVFSNIITEAGVPKEALILEEDSTNTGENIRFTHSLLKQRGLSFSSFILLQKPYMERRTYATFKKQWPDTNTEFQVSSPPIAYENYFTAELNKNLVINIMVGDLQRIREYPKFGYQIEQDVPKDVWAAFEYLVSNGFNKHLVASSS